MSYGEGFLEIFDTMFGEPGLCVMDEPEAPLSFTASLQLVGLMRRIGESGVQVVCATHSPILASTIEVGEHGLQRVK